MCVCVCVCVCGFIYIYIYITGGVDIKVILANFAYFKKLLTRYAYILYAFCSAVDLLRFFSNSMLIHKKASINTRLTVITLVTKK